MSEPLSPYAVRAGTADDLPLVRETIVRAMAWNPERVLPPPEHLLVHPELVRYHAGWGRAGDLGAVADQDGLPVGMAFCRLFTDDDHGEGYVDAATPELVIGVANGHRGNGVGRRLLDALADAARAAGFAQLSLSVDAANPALRLYRRAGFETLRDDGRDVLMLRRL